MTTGRPAIDILTPSLNYRRYIEDAVTSVARQCYPGLSHIVQDGASTDGTPQLLDTLAQRHPQLRQVVMPDQGQSDALNRAAARASSDWLGWLNADEFYLPGAISAAADAIAAEPEADVVFGDCVFVDAHGGYLRLLPAHRFSRLTLRRYGCFIPSCATFVRRSLLVQTGWDPRMRRVMDWHLWLSLAALGARFRYVPRALAAYRLHSAQVTQRPTEKDRAELELVHSIHGLPTTVGMRRVSRLLGLSAHAAQKLVSRGYVRQARANRLGRAADLRWWLTDSAHRRVTWLVEEHRFPTRTGS
ncbi:glycosyltransferase family 2 protein [Streptomyces sp. MK7]|uniref:glycosyltransferase family 2 protein n=1 Tax=Streptomyces sp. MK7 TaxID=3067635 RepID=UPI002931AD21|nr:glycosyltransferase family 2 protein [Streptomyces sp. MK7]